MESVVNVKAVNYLTDVECRLYQNLHRYPSDFELPGAENYEDLRDEVKDGFEEEVDEITTRYKFVYGYVYHCHTPGACVYV